MIDLILNYLIALATLLCLDAFWINIAAKELYRRALGDYLAPQAQLGPGLLLAALLTAGLVYFVIEPGRKDKDFPRSLFRAAGLGVLCYATYDLTNLAVARNWPVNLTIIDILWGAVLMTAVTAITTILMQRWRSK